ncbi:hypothetical protein [Arthrobacter pigmenti]
MSDNIARFLEIARRSASAEEALHITSLQSPAVAEALGRNLAASLASAQPKTVVVWEDQVESTVLAHVVARELRADLVYAFSVEGSLGMSGSLAPGSRAAVVSYDWTEMHGLDALLRFVQSQGAIVAGIASVVAAPVTEAGPGIENHILAESEPDKPETSEEHPHAPDNG